MYGFYKLFRKEKGKGLCACWARTAAGQRPSQRRGPAEPAHARAPGLNLTGGAQLPVGERGRERGEDDRRGPPVITNPWTGGSRCSPATMQATASSGECGDGFRRLPHVGGWWTWPAGVPGSPATRSCGGGASGGGDSGRFRQLQRGETRGKGSEGCRGSRSRQRRSGGGLYLANSGEPKRRSSSSISSSGGSGDELGVQGDY